MPKEFSSVGWIKARGRIHPNSLDRFLGFARHMTQADNATPHQAAAYDKGVRQTIPFYEEIHRQTIDVVKTVRPDVECWLDTGCGTGYLVELALPVFPKTRFVLVDPSEAMLKQAMKRLKDVPKNRIRFLQPIPSEGLLSCAGEIAPQVITSILCHHYSQPEQRRQAIQCCHQMLGGGGILVTFENVAPSTSGGTEIGLSRWKRYQLERGRELSAVEEHLGRFNTRFFPLRVEEHLDLLKEAGFRVVELFWFSQMQAGFYAIK